MVVTRVRVSLAGGELEIEGSEDFVEKYQGVVGELLDKLKEVPVAKVVTTAPGTDDSSRSDSTGDGRSQTLPEFGEALHGLPKGASGTDQILVAGFYAQQGSADSTFTTADANKLLLEQGIKLANPTQSLNNNQSAKRVFKVGKRWKIAKPGEDYLRTLGISV